MSVSPSPVPPSPYQRKPAHTIEEAPDGEVKVSCPDGQVAIQGALSRGCAQCQSPLS